MPVISKSQTAKLDVTPNVYLGSVKLMLTNEFFLVLILFLCKKFIYSLIKRTELKQLEVFHHLTTFLKTNAYSALADTFQICY